MSDDPNSSDPGKDFIFLQHQYNPPYSTGICCVTLQTSVFLRAALPSLLRALNECRTSLPASDEAFNFLSGVLKSKELNALVNVHSQILNRVKDEHFHPVLSNGQQIAFEVLDLLTTRRNLSPDFEEICSLLKNSHLQVSVFQHF